jgi:hypothetical protein
MDQRGIRELDGLPMIATGGAGWMFDEEKYRDDMQGWIAYFRTAWKMALELAEELIAPSPYRDDCEAADLRREVVFRLATGIFDKLTIGVEAMQAIIAEQAASKEG